MAGYLLTFSEKEDAEKCMEECVYTTLMNPAWGQAADGTLGDYVTMHAGDNIYFFSNRLVYGIGEIVDVVPGRCVTENFPGATSKEYVRQEDFEGKCLVPTSSKEGRVGRWVIAFKPAPMFLGHGVDMDDLLASNPDAFRSLRVFWKRTFIKLDDEENEAFKAAILRRNIVELNNFDGLPIEARIPEQLCFGDEPNVLGLLASFRKEDGSLSREMLLETGLLYQLSKLDPRTCKVFGRWDYLSHQVNASPFKPVDYMDRMDVFGYRWIEGFRPIIESYLVAELKKDRAHVSDIPQVMKYVDWTCGEYAHGDYSLIRGFLIAHDFDENIVQNEESERDYVVGYRPSITKKWNCLRFVRYYVTESGYIQFSLVGDEVTAQS